MTKQKQEICIIEAIKDSNHPFREWVLLVTAQMKKPFKLNWLLTQQEFFNECLLANRNSLSFGSFTEKEVLHELKSLWDQAKRLYFRDYFLDEIFKTKSHPLYSLLKDLSKGIHSHAEYLAFEIRWNQQVGGYCLSLGDHFSNLARLALSKFYTVQKNQYYDRILSVEIKTSSKNPFYSFVQLIESNERFDDSLYRTFEEQVSFIETLISDQNEQYQRKLFAVLRPYFIRGKQAYYRPLLTSSWKIAEADICRHPHWVSSHTFLTQLNSTSIETETELGCLISNFKKSQSARKKEMGPFNFAWIQKEFEKRLRFLEKRISFSSVNQFAPWLKQMREAHKLSYRQLEQLSGISSTYLHRLEAGERKSPSIPVAKKIAEAFNVSFEVVAKFVDSEVLPDSDALISTMERELDLLKLLETKHLVIGNSKPLSQKECRSLSQLLRLITDQSFDPNNLLDTIKLMDLVKTFREN